MEVSMSGRCIRLIVAWAVLVALVGSAHFGSQGAAAAGSGTILAWGRDDRGQLANPATANDATPTQVAIVGNAVAVAGGSQHSLALKPDGTLFSWGNDTFGELGDGTVGSPDLRGPQAIAGVSGVRAIAARERVNLALRNNGTVLAWGDNSSGLMGNGSAGGLQPRPTQIAGLTNVVAIALGDRHALALKADGTVWAWGSDGFGQLGDGTVGSPSVRATPGQVTGLTNVKAIAAGSTHSVALQGDGIVRTWGRDDAGQLGDGPGGDASGTPTPVVVHLANVKAIAAGGHHTLAVRSDGTAWAWGSDGLGQQGDGTSGPANTSPVQVVGLTNVTTVTAGDSYSAAVRADGTVWAWGSDVFGNLGDGTTSSPLSQPVPTQVPRLNGVLSVVSAGEHTLAIRAENFVVSWGHDSDGQLGDGGVGNPVDDQSPNSIGLATNLRAIAGGEAHTLALKADGTVMAWGDDSAGQLGDGTIGGPFAVATPRAVVGLTNVIAIAAGRNHSLALRGDGTVWSWGSDGTANGGATPAQVTGVTGAIGIAAGRDHSLALRGDGRVFAWGSNSGGQLGVSGADSPTPVAVPDVTRMIAVAAGGSHSLALRADGSAWAWGDDGAGQLGDGTIGSTGGIDPDPVVGLGNAMAVSAGSTHSLALRADGTVWAWGADFQGPNDNSQATPAQVGGLAGVTAVAAGHDFGVALRSDGTVAVWGFNAHGQLAGTAALGAADVSPNAVAGVTNLTGLGVGPRSHHVAVLK
jgi:alpha-tubulin suppressor-like RCC1 family protein